MSPPFGFPGGVGNRPQRQSQVQPFPGTYTGPPPQQVPGGGRNDQRYTGYGQRVYDYSRLLLILPHPIDSSDHSEPLPMLFLCIVLTVTAVGANKV